MENFLKFSQVESFRKLSLRCSRIAFLLAFFYRNIYVSGNFYRIICFFYSRPIVYVAENFPESFRTFSSLALGDLRVISRVFDLHIFFGHARLARSDHSVFALFFARDVQSKLNGGTILLL
jgi:hypothetical protein